MPSTFAKNFRYLRELKEISQTEMGEELGLTRASVDAYEDGRAMPPFLKLRRIAEYFSLSIETITDEELWDEPMDFEIKKLKEEVSPEIQFDSNTDFSRKENIQNRNSRSQKRNESDSGIPLVERKYFNSYLNSEWSKLKPNLKRISFHLPEIEGYRAFESKDDFPILESVLVGLQVSNPIDIKNGECYLIVTQNDILYRRIYNQVTLKGQLILSGEVPEISTSEIRISDVKEVWEVKAYMSTVLPRPSQDLTNVIDLVNKLQKELDRLNSKN